MKPEFSLPRTEEEIQKFWEDNNILEKSLVLRRGRKKFVFYEGPPTANGLPHIGHFLTRAFKDLFIRYKTMQGFFVPRRAGWDTHGLPVEIEVEKELGLKSKKEIEKYGIAKFNKKARESVWRYKTEWEKFSKRIGFWLDFENPYITYENSYIETLWRIIRQFDKRKFLYKSHKVLPWCPRCGTALSSHELGQDDVYKTVTEDSVIVEFRVKEKNNTSLLAWTTTPWTLPGNVALAVHPDISYVEIEKKDMGAGDTVHFILAKERLPEIFENDKYKITKEIKGRDLVGLEYEPLFDIPALKSGKSYKVYAAEFVNIEEGTGVVHTAVMYGENDYQLGEKIGLPKHHTVDKEGKFTEDIPEFAGQFVKDAEKDIIAYLKNKNLLFKVEPYAHEYPFCWRCKTPLLYYAADSWFVKVTAVKKQLIANNKKINWIPPYIKEGRFGQWLNEVKDWAFSRDRFWGTPLPIWQCEKCKENLVIGSLKELEKYRCRKPNQYYIVRHAESTKNIDGWEINSVKLESDKYDLTKKGVGQAEKLAKDLKGRKIDSIFCSPFLRARRTAGIIAEELGLEEKVDHRLKEIDHGSVCEGKDYYACISKEEYPHKDFNTKLGLDGESRNGVRKRVFDFVKETEGRYEGKNILIVSHGDPLWLLEGISKGLSEKELFSAKKNQILGIKDNAFKLIKFGEKRVLVFSNYPRDEFGNPDLHRPYIDEVILKCLECGGTMKRIPEVADVWFDSGSMPFAAPVPTLRDIETNGPVPKETEGILNGTTISASGRDFPADFITEGVDQTRGWFYTLLAVSTLLGKSAPYKNVISLGHVLDKDGKKMSKSIGNVVKPDYVIEKFGADTARWWFYRVNQTGESKSFREEELKEINNGFVRVILNSLRFWQLYATKIKNQNLKIKSFHEIKLEEFNLLDKWLLSRWNNLVKSVTESMDEYDATAASREIEKFAVEDLSNWWIRRSRDKFQIGDNVYQKDLLKFVLLELAKLTAPFAPFLAEYLHGQLYDEATRDMDISKYRTSVHFQDWPKADKKLIDEKLEEEMEFTRRVVNLGLAARKEAGIKVRQPLNKLKVISKSEKLKIDEDLLDLIKEEVNVKDIEFSAEGGSAIGGKESAKEELSVVLDTEISPALMAEGWVREFVRMIQDARKDAGYDYNQKIEAHWFSEEDSLSEAIGREEESIKQKTVLKKLHRSSHNPEAVYDIEREQELEPGRKIWLGLKK